MIFAFIVASSARSEAFISSEEGAAPALGLEAETGATQDRRAVSPRLFQAASMRRPTIAITALNQYSSVVGSMPKGESESF